MGCAPSLLEDENQQTKEDDPMAEFSFDPKNPENMLLTYIALDKEIVHLENASPAPMFGRAIASSRKMRIMLDECEDISHTSNEEIDDVEKLFMELGLNNSPTVAAEHEEFIAKANRKALERNKVHILRKALYVSEKKLESCAKKVNYLQNLYQQQEALLMNVFGAAYGSEKERLIEQETDTMRNFRDTLALGVLQWEDGVEDLQSAAETSQRAIISWKSLKKPPIDRKLKLTVDARNNLQVAVFLVQRAQETLPGVQFPYCSTRELSAVLQAIEYTFTDILIDERYNHALKVYENFQQRISALLKWMKKTLTDSLLKELREFDEKVIKVAKKLREERIEQICKKLKIPNKNMEKRASEKGEPSVYQRPMEPENRYKKENRYGDVLASPRGDLANLGPTLGIAESPGRIFTDPNLQREFEDKLAARRSAMWPSRRMEELRQLTLRDF